MLPWFFVHGLELWLVALGLVTASSVAIVFFGPQLEVRRRSRRARRSSSATITSAAALREGAHVTLLGRLEARGAPPGPVPLRGAAALTLALAKGTSHRALVRLRAPELSIRLDQIEVDLVGTVEVLVGSQQSSPIPFSRTDPALRDATFGGETAASAALFSGDPDVRTSALADGDAVLAAGVLHRAARSDEGLDYRSVADRWSLAPAPAEPDDASAVLLVARARPVVHGASWGRRALLVLMSPLAFVLLSWIIGEFAFSSMQEQLDGLAHQAAPARLAAMTTAQLAATMPFRRQETIRRVSRAFALLRRHHDAQTTRDQVALAELAGDHALAVQVLLDHGQIDAAEQIDTLHPTRATARLAEARYEQGHYEAASRLFERAPSLDIIALPPPPGPRAAASLAVAPGDPSVHSLEALAALVHLLAGRLDLAEARIQEELGSYSAGNGLPMLCVADWIAARQAPDPTPMLARLRGHAFDDQTHQCAMLLADLLQGRDRRAVLSSFRGTEAASFLAGESIRRLLEAESAPGDGASRPPEAPEMGKWRERYFSPEVHPKWLIFGREEAHLLQLVPALFLTPELRETPAVAHAFDFQQAAEAAFVASATGNHANALLWIGRGRSSPRSDDGSGTESWLRHVIRQRGSAGPFAQDVNDTWLASPSRRWNAKSAGDDGTLAEELDQAPFEADQAYLIAHQLNGRSQALFEWLRWGPRVHRSATLIGLTAELENRRLFALSIGDEEMAVVLGAIVGRHRAALERRALAVPLAVIEAVRLRAQRQATISP